MRLVVQGILQLIAGTAVVLALLDRPWSDDVLIPITLLVALSMLHRWHLRRNKYFVDLDQFLALGTDIPELLVMGPVGLLALCTLGVWSADARLEMTWSVLLGVAVCRLASVGSFGLRAHPDLYRGIRCITVVVFVVATIWTLGVLRVQLIRQLAM
ncbi:MAG: hypothetical protein NTU88_15575 [Armatimonadetes bacterium]|nr:hypothetical protein [Armatimonadota bacterium]